MNVIIFGQVIVFVIFVWFCMKYVWLFLMVVIEKCQKEIFDGLVFVECVKKDLDFVQVNVIDQLKKVKVEVQVIIEQVNKCCFQILDEVKVEVEQECIKIVV